MGAIKTIAFCIFLFALFHDGIASITVNDTYTAQNLVNILTNNSTCSTTSTLVFQTPFQGLRKLWFFNSGTSSFPFQEEF
jgi:acyl-CoA synthetase (AMP-forming)/AMP-acid ligase II